MVVDLIAAAGVLLSGIGVADELVMTFKDLRKWKEQDLEVDQEWLELAKAKGQLPAADYEWINERRVPSAELKGTAQTVLAYNKEKRIVYRVVQGNAATIGGRIILVRKGKASD